jgi:XapX domain-containing protein
MKIYLLSLAAGLLAGVLYGLLNVRSPAPPVIALVGLLGILVGEQIVAAARRALSDEPVTVAWIKQECGSQILGTTGGACAPPVSPGSRAKAPPRARDSEA